MASCTSGSPASSPTTENNDILVESRSELKGPMVIRCKRRFEPSESIAKRYKMSDGSPVEGIVLHEAVAEDVRDDMG